MIRTETLSQIRFSPINGALSQNSLARWSVEEGTSDRSHRAYPKRFEMFIPIHAFRGRRNPPFAMQAKFLKTLLRNSGFFRRTVREIRCNQSSPIAIPFSSLSLSFYPPLRSIETRRTGGAREPSIRRTRGGKLLRGRRAADECRDLYTSFSDSDQWRYPEAEGTITSRCNSSSRV